jgi:hypothetical protein
MMKKEDSDDELEGRSLAQEHDYGDKIKAAKQIKQQNMQQHKERVAEK